VSADAATDAAALGELFLRDMLAIPGGEKIKTCIQCGTCSASCPTSYAMDYTPRQILAFLRAGMLDKVLRSSTPWLCASCYTCTVRCPSGIKFTDVMYELKRLCVRHGIYPKGQTSPVMSQSFMDVVDRYGRNQEQKLLTAFTLKTNPLGGLRMLPLGIKLLLRGRLPLGAKAIGGLEDLRKMVEVAEAEAARRAEGATR